MEPDGLQLWNICQKSTSLFYPRSENSLKNRFYGGLRRLIRKINKIECQYKMRKSKPLRYESLLRILEYSFSTKLADPQCVEEADELHTFLITIKENLLKASWSILNGEAEDSEFVAVIKSIHKFNSMVRNPTAFMSRKPDVADEKLTRVESEVEKDKKLCSSRLSWEIEGEVE